MNNIFNGWIVFTAVLLCTNTSSAIDIASAGSGVWSAPATWVGGIIPDGDDNVTIDAGHTITLTANASCVNLTVAGALDISGNYAFRVSGTLTMSGAGTFTSNDMSQLEITDVDGLQPQFVIPDGIVKLRKLTLNRTTGAASDHNLDFDDNVPVTSAGYESILLTNGILSMTSMVDNDIVYLKSDNIAKDIPCGDANHIDGKVSRLIEKDSGWHVFPVGDSGLCRQFDVSSISNGPNRESIVEFFRTSYADLDCNATLPGGVTDKYYWEHEKVNEPGAEPNVSRRMYFNAVEDFPPGFDLSELRIATFNESSTVWSAITTGWQLGVNFIYQDVDNSSNNKAWTWGSVLTNILPVTLVSFAAAAQDNTVVLRWTTAVEINNDFFTIERTQNGLSFEEIGTVDGAGTTYSQVDYLLADNNPLSGTSYYRLKQTDLDGNFTYVGTASAVFADNKGGCNIKVYPNPCRGSCTVSLAGCDEEFISIAMYDAMGRQIMANIPSKSGGGYYIDGTNNLAPGTYIISGASETQKVSKKVLIQWIASLI